MPERIHAPDFTGATAWLGVARPPSIRDLRGQVVILDFWTYCCVNCMHVLPILRELEERHAADPLVVIGVHSAKFDGERDPEHIRAAMGRYGVEHPVCVDGDFEVWRRYAVRSWPTLVVIRPDGTLAAVAPGEPPPEVLGRVVEEALAEARRDGTLAAAPLRLLEKRAEPSGPLAFPGKVLAAPDGRIIVADSGHHRVLVLDASGAVLQTIGSGLRGHREGPFSEAVLDDPQGMALDGDALYIADSRAHVVWRADLRTQVLKRLAGAFELGRDSLRPGRHALDTPLRSPWALALRGRTLHVALAGSHQLAAIDLEAGALELTAGSSREALVDGPAREGALAQPSGLSLAGERLYLADSESSAVRWLDLTSGQLGTVAGGPGLFDFGDAVGPVAGPMLQHPLEVLATPSGLLVADTYNGKLKRFTPDGSRLEPFGDERFSQPAGLALAPDGSVLVTDTDAHRIVRLSADGRLLGVVEVRGAPEPKRGSYRAAQAGPRLAATGAGWFTAIIEAPPGVGLAAGEGVLRLELRAPEGFELNDGAPLTARFEVSRRSDLLSLREETLTSRTRGGRSQVLEVRVGAVHAADVDSELLAEVRAVVCDARDHAACYPVQNFFRVPLRLLRAGQREVAYPLSLEVGATSPG